MSEPRVFDAPVDNPDNDLLGMSPYAQTLADFIETIHPPFTIGVYGEWGEGKTTFVKFLEHFLTHPTRRTNRPIKFIAFSAWPHTTPNVLWRALTLQIAKGLYNVSAETAATNAQTKERDNSLISLLLRILNSYALVLYKPSPPPSPLAEYRALETKLDRAFVSVTKDTEQQLQIDQEMAMLAIVKAAAAALGAMSPLVAGIRSLLGLDTKINLAELLHQQKNQATREVIETIDQFKRVFRELFSKKAENYRQVIVFIDDLDRCMPDVALNILEAIKMFLGEVGCIFVVAADERLIGQGLRLRYKGLLESTDRREAQTFFARKGQEYFEKIIQLGIRVPPRTPEQTHRFISAEFPDWMPATDIIQMAIGDNPRRLKQYCSWLSYKYMVSQMQARLTKEG